MPPRYGRNTSGTVTDLGALFVDNCLPDGTFRFHADGSDFGQMCLLGTFSPYTVVNVDSAVKIGKHIPLEKAALVGCGVTTGWGSATYAADVQSGETVAGIGIGGAPSRAPLWRAPGTWWRSTPSTGSARRRSRWAPPTRPPRWPTRSR